MILPSTLDHDARPRALRWLRTLRLEIASEILKHLRLPTYAVSTIALPVMFYVIFGVTFGGQQVNPREIAAYLLATYGAFGVIGAALFSFGVSVAVERGQGWMRLKRASPMPGEVMVLAKLVNALAFAAAVVMTLMIVGTLFGGVRLASSEVVALFGALILGALPFCVLGQAFGYALGPNSAPVVLNLVYLPMSFASGLWIPIDQLPGFVQTVAPWLPSYHLGQLALSTIGMHGGGQPILHALALTVTAVVGSVAAVILYRRSSLATYG